MAQAHRIVAQLLPLFDEYEGIRLPRLERQAIAASVNGTK